MAKTVVVRRTVLRKSEETADPRTGPGDGAQPPHAATRGQRAQLRWLVVNLTFNLIAICVDAIALGDRFGLAVSLRLLLVTPVFLAAIGMHFWSPSPVLRTCSTSLATIVFIATVTGLAQYADDAFSSRYLMIAIFVVFVSILFSGLSWTATRIVGSLGWLAFSVLAVMNRNLQIVYMNIDLVFLCGSTAVLALVLRRRQDVQMSQIRAMRMTDALRVSELNEANAKLARLSHTDPLTGLSNRRRLDEFVEDLAVSLAPSVGYGVLMIDVDHFKKLNDCSGHAEGDGCLRTIAKAIASAVRSHADIAVRYGGEEFALILCDADAQETLAVAERLRSAIVGLALPNAGLGPQEIVTVSIGAHAASQTEPVAASLRLADELLYVAKSEGRNRVAASHTARTAAPMVMAQIV